MSLARFAGDASSPLAHEVESPALDEATAQVQTAQNKLAEYQKEVAELDQQGSRLDAKIQNQLEEIESKLRLRTAAIRQWNEGFDVSVESTLPACDATKLALQDLLTNQSS